MKVKIAGEHIVTLTKDLAEYTPVADAQETDITCVADVAGSLVGKYFKLYAANNSSKYYVYYDIESSAEVSAFTTIANVTRGLAGKYITFNAADDEKKYVSWFNTGDEEKSTITAEAVGTTGTLGGKYWTFNTLTPATKYKVWYQTGGAKEKSTLTAIADNGNGSLGATYFTFSSDIAGTEADYYTWYQTGGAYTVSTITAQADVAGGLGGLYWGSFEDDAGAYYVWYNSGAKEKSTVTTVADDGNGSLGATYFTFSDDVAGVETDYYTWYQTGGAAASSTVTAEAASTVSAAGVGKYITFSKVTGGAVDYQAWFNCGKANSDRVTTLAASGLSGGEYFLFSTHDATTEDLYNVWFTVDGAGVDPLAGGTGIVCALLSTDTDAEVATKVAAAITGSAAAIECTATALTNTVTITNSVKATQTLAVDGNSGFTFLNLELGRDEQTAPVAGGTTQLEVELEVDSDANTVAEALRTVINGVTGLTAIRTDAVVTATSDGVGSCAPLADGNTLWSTFTLIKSGRAADVDPAVAASMGIEVTINDGDTANGVALATRTAISGSAALVTVTGTDNGVIIENNDYQVVTGTVVDSVVPTGFTFTRDVIGRVNDADPAPGVATGIEVRYSIDSLATVIGDATVTAINGAGIDLTASSGATDDIIILTNDNVGTYANAVDANTLWASFVATKVGRAVDTDPAVAATTGIEVTISDGETADNVALATRTALTGVAGITVTGATNEVIIENNDKQVVTGLVAVGTTGFSVVRDKTGRVIDTEPTVADSTAVVVNVVDGAANQNDVGLATRTALGSIPDMTVTGADAAIIVECDTKGVCPVLTVGDTTWTASARTTGTAPNTQPATSLFVPGSYFIEVDLSADDTDAEVATAIRTALNADSEVTDYVTISGATNQVIITNDDNGVSTDASIGNSGFSVSKTTEGWSDPLSNNPLVSGYTATRVAIVPNETDDNVAEKTKDVIHALSDFTATRTNEVISVVNAANGECSSASDGHPKATNGTKFTFTVTTSGISGIAAPTTYKLYEITGTQPDLTYYNGSPIPGKTKDVTLFATEKEIEYIEKGF